MEVQSQTFDLSLETVPSVEVLEEASDPEKRAELLRAAGFEAQASNLPKRIKADRAGQKFKELPEGDFRLWSDFLANATTPSGAPIEPPDDVLIRMRDAREAGLFDDVIVLSHPVTYESLLLGVVNTGKVIRRFQVGQWWIGSMTTIEQLRKQRRVTRAIGRQQKQIAEWRPEFSNGMSQTEIGVGALYVMLTLLATVGSLVVFWLTDSWWVFIILLGVATLACDTVPRKWKRAWNVVDNLTGTVFCLGLLLGPVHLYFWNTANHTKEVLVCSANPRAHTNDWGVVTSEDKFTVDAGFYDGQYYSMSSKSAAQSLVGKWVKITYHGHIGDPLGHSHPPFISDATTLRVGSCGK